MNDMYLNDLITGVQLANLFADCLVCDVTEQKKGPVLTSW